MTGMPDMRDRSLDEEMKLVAEVEARIKTELAELRKRVQPERAWYSLAEAAALKGVSASTLRARVWLQPRGGREDGILNGRRCWRAETIREWLDQTDQDLEAEQDES